MPEAAGERERPARRTRRDAEANRERVLAAATRAILREGPNVPIATIAAEAGVGVGTLYRKYADREALLHALEHRAYGMLNQILDAIDSRTCTGLDAVAEFLRRALAIGDQLVLPLHGAPPLISDDAVAARQAINRRLERFIKRGRTDGSIHASINATDVIVFSALITQPLPHNLDWPHITARQLAIFVNGLAGTDAVPIPRPAIKQQQIEAAFTLLASEDRSSRPRTPPANRGDDAASRRLSPGGRDRQTQL